ncbi:MAG TPA: hypothetical protein PKK23_00865 [Nitrospirales bacterium]|nr:hypothetical protein [Nitrospirales bacterium]
MHVKLDEDIWEVSDGVQLGEVLAEVSDRAQAKGCLVTKLLVGNRTMTDRELVPPTLSKMVGSFGSVSAVSKRLETIVEFSHTTGKNFGRQVHLQGQDFVKTFRQGKGNFRQLDQWFGQVADYLEWLQIQESVGLKKSEVLQDLSRWVKELMKAREMEDVVRIADMLEYEVLPRLAPSIGTTR